VPLVRRHSSSPVLLTTKAIIGVLPVPRGPAILSRMGSKSRETIYGIGPGGGGAGDRSRKEARSICSNMMAMTCALNPWPRSREQAT
jgi:hypothetical protein